MSMGTQLRLSGRLPNDVKFLQARRGGTPQARLGRERLAAPDIFIASLNAVLTNGRYWNTLKSRHRSLPAPGMTRFVLSDTRHRCRPLR